MDAVFLVDRGRIAEVVIFLDRVFPFGVTGVVAGDVMSESGSSRRHLDGDSGRCSSSESSTEMTLPVEGTFRARLWMRKEGKPSGCFPWKAPSTPMKELTFGGTVLDHRGVLSRMHLNTKLEAHYTRRSYRSILDFKIFYSVLNVFRSPGSKSVGFAILEGDCFVKDVCHKKDKRWTEVGDVIVVGFLRSIAWKYCHVEDI